MEGVIEAIALTPAPTLPGKAFSNPLSKPLIETVHPSGAFDSMNGREKLMAVEPASARKVEPRADLASAVSAVVLRI